MSNNPTMDLLTEIAEYNIAQRAVDKDTEVVEPTVCLSLGTGVPPVKKVSQFFESSQLILKKNHNFVIFPSEMGHAQTMWTAIKGGGLVKCPLY